MKNSIIIAIIALGTILSINTASANAPLPSTPSISAAPMRLTCTINMGRRSKDCTGFGICSIVISTEMAVLNRANSATGSIDFVNDKPTISFQKSSMSRETITKFFANGKFVVEEDYQTQLEIKSTREAGSGMATGRRQYQPLIIRKGIYAVKDAGDSFVVAF